MGKQDAFVGFDIGGTGIKAALIDTSKGKLLTEKMRELTTHNPQRGRGGEHQHFGRGS